LSTKLKLKVSAFLVGYEGYKYICTGRRTE
jgi:hypothetical protein